MRSAIAYLLLGCGFAACTQAIAQTTAPIPAGNEALTGAWYDPAVSGQGLEFVISDAPDSPDRRLLIGAWFTYNVQPLDYVSPEYGQRWFSLQAEYDENATAVPIQIYQSLGGTFAAGPATSPVLVGTGTLTFSSCTSATLDYGLIDGLGAPPGSMSLVNLTPNDACAGTGSESRVGSSGTWYEPSASGQGLIVVGSDNDETGLAFVSWFTYPPSDAADTDYGQRWLSAQGIFEPPQFSGDTIATLEIFESTGGIFNNAAPPASTVPVGSMLFIWHDCETAEAEYTIDSGAFAGESGDLDLVRLGGAPLGGCSGAGEP